MIEGRGCWLKSALTVIRRLSFQLHADVYMGFRRRVNEAGPIGPAFLVWPPVKRINFRGSSHWSSLKPFLVRADETPSTDSVHERSSPFLHSATIVAKGRSRRFPLYDRRPIRASFDIEAPKDDRQLPGHCGNRFLCDPHPA